MLRALTDQNFFRSRVGFDKGNLEWLEKIFKQTVGNEREIRREEFKTIVISKNVSKKYMHFFYFIRRILISISNREILFSSHFSPRESFKYSIRTTRARYHFKNFWTLCINLLESLQMTKLDFCSKFTILMVTIIICVFIESWIFLIKLKVK